MNKIELKRLAKDMSANYLRRLAENDDALENGLEMRNVSLEEEEKVKLIEAIQEIIERLWK